LSFEKICTQNRGIQVTLVLYASERHAFVVLSSFISRSKESCCTL